MEKDAFNAIRDGRIRLRLGSLRRALRSKVTRINVRSLLVLSFLEKLIRPSGLSRKNVKIDRFNEMTFQDS